MPQVAGRFFQVVGLREQARARRVAQAVHALGGHAGHLADGGDVPPGALGRAVGKYLAVGVSGKRLQRLLEGRAHRHGARLAAFALPDGQVAAGEVHVRPAQRDALAGPQTRVGAERHEHSVEGLSAASSRAASSSSS